MKTLITALTLGALMAGAASAQTGNHRIDHAREQAIQECMALQKRDSHDGYEGSRGGGLQWQYRACMVDHGQQP